MSLSSELKKLVESKSWEDLNAMILDVFKVSLDDMSKALSTAVEANSDEIAKQFINIAPLGDYGLLMEDPSKMSEFLKTEAHKPEHWIVSSLVPEKTGYTRFIFNNDAVDDGTTFVGYVTVNAKGQIKHAFAQAEE